MCEQKFADSCVLFLAVEECGDFCFFERDARESSDPHILGHDRYERTVCIAHVVTDCLEPFETVPGRARLRSRYAAGRENIRLCPDFFFALEYYVRNRAALNFDYPEAAAGLFRVYQWALECIRARNYAGAIAVLKPLRDAWAAVENQPSATSASAVAMERSSVVYAA